jgi:hypothetical protein
MFARPVRLDGMLSTICVSVNTSPFERIGKRRRIITSELSG